MVESLSEFFWLWLLLANTESAGKEAGKLIHLQLVSSHFYLKTLSPPSSPQLFRSEVKHGSHEVKFMAGLHALLGPEAPPSTFKAGNGRSVSRSIGQ